MDKNTILTALLALFYLLMGREVKSQGTTADSLSLADCIHLAWKHNYEVQRGRLANEAAAIDYRESKQNLIPAIDFGIGHNLSQGRRIDLVTNQYINQRFSAGNQFLNGSAVLFRGLESLHRIRQQAAAGSAANFEEQSVRDRVMLDVILAYIQVLTSRDVLAQTELRIELTRQQLKRTTDLHNSGAVSPSDYYDLKGQLAADLNLLNSFKQTYMEAQVALAAVINLTLEELKPLETIDFQLLTSSYPADKAGQVFESAALWLPSLKAAQFRMQQAETGVRVARAGHSPRLTMGAGFESTYSSNSGQGYFEQTKNNLGRYISFGLRIPITDHIFVKNSIARAKIDLQDAIYVSKNTQNTVQRQVSQSVLSLDIARENYQNLVEREENFQESFRIATSRFNEGDINSVIFLTAKNNMEQAAADKIIGRYQWALQQYIAEYFTGQSPFATGRNVGP